MGAWLIIALALLPLLYAAVLFATRRASPNHEFMFEMVRRLSLELPDSHDDEELRSSSAAAGKR